MTADVGRNAENRLRVLGIQATLQLGVPSGQLEHLDRVLNSFEAYCTVTQSVGQGIPIQVTVLDVEWQCVARRPGRRNASLNLGTCRGM